ncbi:hypothetical protein BDV93DRAFT_482106, partial [Ceratobasidium sp. AG-I]
MSVRDTEEVWLSGLRFANFKPRKQAQTNQTEGVFKNTSEQPACQGQAGLTETSPQCGKSDVYDQLEGDKPGEELTAEATIWKSYKTEAQDCDDELVDRQHKNIDVMLVFAALFSAILTSFLLDSKSMLQPDPSDITAMLLTRIAQRLESPNSPPPPVEMPVFKPSIAAWWINGLWFTSLGLSLVASLLAMLAKEWLMTFASSRPRAARSYTIDRQARLDALSSWGALLMVDLLPLFLHVALLLFSLGLVVYLYATVDLTIATIITLMTGATTLFYVITAIIATWWEVCPF